MYNVLGLNQIAVENQSNSISTLSSSSNDPVENLASIESSITALNAAGTTKEWHQSIPQDLRIDLVRKL